MRTRCPPTAARVPFGGTFSEEINGMDRDSAGNITWKTLFVLDSGAGALQGESRIGAAEPLAHHSDRDAGLHRDRGMCVSQIVESDPG